MPAERIGRIGRGGDEQQAKARQNQLQADAEPGEQCSQTPPGFVAQTDHAAGQISAASNRGRTHSVDFIRAPAAVRPWRRYVAPAARLRPPATAPERAARSSNPARASGTTAPAPSPG